MRTRNVPCCAPLKQSPWLCRGSALDVGKTSLHEISYRKMAGRFSGERLYFAYQLFFVLSPLTAKQERLLSRDKTSRTSLRFHQRTFLLFQTSTTALSLSLSAICSPCKNVEQAIRENTSITRRYQATILNACFFV